MINRLQWESQERAFPRKSKDRMYLVRKTSGQTLEQIDSMFADLKVMLTGAMEDLHTLY